MSTIASIRIETWGKGFVVVGEFGKNGLIPRQEFTSYGDALRAMVSVARREELRHEAGIDSNPLG